MSSLLPGALPFAVLVLSVAVAQNGTATFNHRFGRYYFSAFFKRDPARFLYCMYFQVLIAAVCYIPFFLGTLGIRTAVEVGTHRVDTGLDLATQLTPSWVAINSILAWAVATLSVIWKDKELVENDLKSRTIVGGVVRVLTMLRGFRATSQNITADGFYKAQHADILEFQDKEGSWTFLKDPQYQGETNSPSRRLRRLIKKYEKDMTRRSWKHISKSEYGGPESLLVPLTIYLGRRGLMKQFKELRSDEHP